VCFLRLARYVAMDFWYVFARLRALGLLIINWLATTSWTSYFTRRAVQYWGSVLVIDGTLV